MVKRYGYTWEYLTVSGGGKDNDGNPIEPTESWTPFQCDEQAETSRFVVGQNGDNIPVSYSLYTNVNTGLVKGAKVKNSRTGEIFTVLQIHPYQTFEIWV